MKISVRLQDMHQWPAVTVEQRQDIDPLPAVTRVLLWVLKLGLAASGNEVMGKLGFAWKFGK